jgi:hypothetical protein
MRRSLAILALAGLSACTNEIDESTRPENIVGTYQLVSYGGAALPTTIRSDSVTVVLLSGTLVINSDRTWTETQLVSTTFRGVTASSPLAALGNWTQVRPLAYLAFNDTVNGYQFSGTASGGSVVLESATGRQILYRR